MLFEIQKTRLTPRLFYFKQHFSTSEVILQQTRKHVLYFLSICGFDGVLSVKSNQQLFSHLLSFTAFENSLISLKAYCDPVFFLQKN